MVCLRNICINTLHKGNNDDDDDDYGDDNDDDDDDDYDNNNNNNNNNNGTKSVTIHVFASVTKFVIYTYWHRPV